MYVGHSPSRENVCRLSKVRFGHKQDGVLCRLFVLKLGAVTLFVYIDQNANDGDISTALAP